MLCISIRGEERLDSPNFSFVNIRGHCEHFNICGHPVRWGERLNGGSRRKLATFPCNASEVCSMRIFFSLKLRQPLKQILKLVVVLACTSGLVLGLVRIFTSIKTKREIWDLSPFECGFIPRSRGRVSFSIQFFAISLVFLIFDVELVLLFPYLFLPRAGIKGGALLLAMLFFTLLSLRAIYEWIVGVLDWLKF